MTQLSTVADDKARPSATAPVGVIVSMAIALALGIGLGLLVSNVDASSRAQGTNEASLLTHEQFLRINTEDMDHLTPIGRSSVTAVAQADPFMVWNIDSYEWLAQAIQNRHAVGSYFYEINTSLMDNTDSSSASSVSLGGDIISDSEPFGYPNYGRLETYIGAEPEGGVR